MIENIDRKFKKILIGDTEIAGIVNTLAIAYKELGYQVTSIASKNKYYDYDYDIDPENLVFTFFKLKFKSIRVATFFKKLSKLISKSVEEKIKSILIRNILSNTDVYIFVYTTNLWEEERQLTYLKRKGVKIISLFLGSDIRDYVAFKEKFKISHWDFSTEINMPGTELKIKKLAYHEKISDAIFSVPDQSIYAKRSYFHLQIPMETKKFKCKIPNNSIPIIIHAPSKPEIKGTDLILKTLDELKNEGIKFELKLLINLPHNKLINELENADVLIDEIVAHGPGFLSFEAMLCGCAVATKYYEESPQCFKPPVFAIDEYNLKDRLRSLLTNNSLIVDLAKKGNDYAINNNEATLVAENFLNSINSKNFDYKI
ncbi:MAG: glycosyltransferase [Bacteroidetes bacterium]|jgi:hypothetical protein|nr:glycosyltransferase [Bacteroidota bacterium]